MTDLFRFAHGWDYLQDTALNPSSAPYPSPCDNISLLRFTEASWVAARLLRSVGRMRLREAAALLQLYNLRRFVPWRQDSGRVDAWTGTVSNLRRRNPRFLLRHWQ
jgi:hypothetical protein